MWCWVVLGGRRAQGRPQDASLRKQRDQTSIFWGPKWAMAAHNIKCWSESQNTRMWDWACKVAQKHDGRWTYTAAMWQPVAVRVRGRPKTRWHDAVNAYLTHATGNKHTQDDWITTLAKTSCGTECRAGFLAHARLTGSSASNDTIDEETRGSP